MKTTLRLFCMLALIAAGSTLAQAQGPQQEDLSHYSLDVLLKARWHLMSDMSCARTNLGSWIKNTIPTEVRYAVAPGQMVSDMYSGIAKNLGQAMGQSVSDSDEGWCYGQSLVADRLDAAISARIKAMSAADYAQASSSVRKTLDETRGALHLSSSHSSSLSGN